MIFSSACMCEFIRESIASLVGGDKSDSNITLTFSNDIVNVTLFKLQNPLGYFCSLGSSHNDAQTREQVNALKEKETVPRIYTKRCSETERNEC